MAAAQCIKPPLKSGREAPEAGVPRSLSSRRVPKGELPTGRPRFISPDLVARTIYFPPAVLARIETRPGALVELLTILLSEHLQKGGRP